MSILEKEFRGQKFSFHETPEAQVLIDEIFSDNYKVLEKNIEFSPGDIILDIGANEGMFSIMMAKLFPQTRIIALEPLPSTYFNLVRNKGLNSCSNIEAYNIGIGPPGKHTDILVTNKNGMSGGSTSFCTFNPDHHVKVEVGLISLDEAFDLYNIDRCRLLKLDIEGGEYEALYPSTVLPRVDFMTAEYHFNNKLDFKSRRPDGLIVWCANQTHLIHADVCRMCE